MAVKARRQVHTYKPMEHTNCGEKLLKWSVYIVHQMTIQRRKKHLLISITNAHVVQTQSLALEAKWTNYKRIYKEQLS